MRIVSFSVFVFLLALTVASLTISRAIPVANNDIPSLSTTDVLGEPSTRVDFKLYELTFDDEKYEVVLVSGANPDKTSLYSNLDKPETAINIFAKNNCTAIVNGGFYTTENTHVGQFISEYELESERKVSSLFDGYFSINDFGTPRITKTAPLDNLRLSLQTGPLFIVNDRQQNLTIRNDKNARRMAVAVTGENEIVYLGIYDSFSKLLGPKLSDMPDILVEAESLSGYDFADAINLDGGGASMLYIDDYKLPESSPIGSYFCIN